jgi:hypothetical protein
MNGGWDPVQVPAAAENRQILIEKCHESGYMRCGFLALHPKYRFCGGKIMRRSLALLTALAVAGGGASLASANLLTNGNLDLLQDVEIVPGFFLPKPASWQNEGFRTISGPYEDEMSSEPWAGPAPTPVTNDGTANPPPNNQPDYGVFFKPFSGGGANGLATGHLFQDVPATPGVEYVMTGWAGAEPNALMTGAEFALEFLNGGGSVIGGQVLNLLTTLFVDNGEAFVYKQYTLQAVAPAVTVSARVRGSMLGAESNPLGGGQAYVMDDFSLAVVPEPGTALLGLAGLTLVARRRRA